MLGAFLFAQLSLVQVLPALHHVFVTHVLCAEHGELVHADGEAHVSDTPAVQGESGYHADFSAEHQHEHCGVSAAVREPAVTGPAPTASVEVVEEPRPVWGLAAATGSRPIELLALAPKLPPPGV